MVAGAIAFAAMFPAAGAAQSIDQLRELLRERASDLGIGEAVQGLTAFSALPGVSAARFTIDQDVDGASDAKATKFVLPLSYDIAAFGVEGLDLHTEVTVGYMTVDQSFDDLFSGTSLECDVDMRTRSLSAIGGVGLGYAVSRHTTIRPVALFGYTRIEQDADFSGAGADLTDALTEGFLFNYKVNQALAGAAVEVADSRSLADDLRWKGSVRYNHVYGYAFDASDTVLDTNSDFGVLTVLAELAELAELDGPTGISTFGRELRWIGFAGHSNFPGDSSRSFDFSYFFELGGGFEVVDRSVVDGVEGLSLRASGIAGDGIYGWNVGLKLAF